MNNQMKAYKKIKIKNRERKREAGWYFCNLDRRLGKSNYLVDFSLIGFKFPFTKEECGVGGR